MTTIDLNADLGEGCEFDVELLDIVSSCNIACGGHAGDADSMTATVNRAIAKRVAIGAHPSYPDRAGFGRNSYFSTLDDLFNTLINQLVTINNFTQRAGGSIRHIKPHGALYNDAVADRELANLVVRAALEFSPGAAIVGPPQGELKKAAAENSITYIAEAFVDRAYLPDGNLVPRSEPNAVHTDLNTITTQAVTLVRDGTLTAENGDVIEVRADTLCIHGDTPNAGEIGRAVQDVLVASGVEIRAAI